MRALTSLDRAAVGDLRARGERFWLDLTAPTEAELGALRELLALHPLALEDSREFGQRPKVDLYGDQALLVAYGVEPDAPDPPGLVEVHLHVTPAFVVSVHREAFAPLRDLPLRLQGHRDADGGWAVYAVLDALTDSFFPALQALGNLVDEVELEVLEAPRRDHVQRIAALRRDLAALRRVAAPQRDLFHRGAGDVAALPGLPAAAGEYLRDVGDHLVTVAEQIDSQRDALRGALDVYASTNAQALNESNERLTLISTIFLPLTFITGFFGQNFGWLVDHVGSLRAFVVLGGGGLLVPLVLFSIYFRRKGYFGGGR